MDKTAWIAVILCSLGILYFATRPVPQMPDPGPGAGGTPVETAEGEQAPVPGGNPGEGNPQPDPQTPAPVPVDEQTLELETDKVIYTFSTRGGGVSKATLKEHKALNGDDIVINGGFEAKDGSEQPPIGALSRGTDLPKAIDYSMSQPDPKTVVFTGITPSKIEITKTYRLTDDSETGDPYLLALNVNFKNVSGIQQTLNDYSLYAGALTHLHKDEQFFYVLYNWCSEGDVSYKDVNWFNGGKFVVQFRSPSELLTDTVENLQWGGPINQFFSSLVVPDEAKAGSIWARRTEVNIPGIEEVEGSTKKYYAIQGGVSVPGMSLEDGATASFSCQLYTGPRELQRLEKNGHDLKGVMHYDTMPVFGGMMGIIPTVSSFLLKLMIKLGAMVGNWGVAILIITFLIRLIIWPLHAKSTKTMKRMAKLSPMINDLREKYSDDPQKMQTETMKLYRDYGVNPVGGCLPVFLQLPIFLGYYTMLRSAVELRGKEFLWVKDLSMPDTLYTFKNFPIFGELDLNLLPLLMAGTMILQMKLAPKAGDKMQQRIFLFMPVIFLFICYNFASALALYWTGQNIFSIGQTWWTNRQDDVELVKKPKKAFDPKKSLMQQQQGAGKKPKKKRPPRTGG